MIKSLALLYKQTTTGKTQTWEIQVEADKFRTISGQLNGKLITNEWTICNGKNIGQSNETSPSDQALKEAEAKITKKLESGYSDSLQTVGKAKYFEPMLAQKWQDRREKLEFPLFIQPKLDGCRCIVNKDGMWSRNGKPIVSAPHIFEQLKDYFKTNPTAVFDGELYNHTLKNDFNKIISLVKKTKPESEDLLESKKTIEYWIYDYIDSDTGSVFEARTTKLKQIGLVYDSLVLVQTIKAISEKETDEWYEKWVSEGFEGQMVRMNDVYENKRSKYLLKRKDFVDEEYLIKDIVEGEGNRTGTAGYMTFENKDGKPFKSNIKGNFEYLADVLKQRGKLINKMATIKYFNLTPDGIPRFPFVTSIRDYE